MKISAAAHDLRKAVSGLCRAANVRRGTIPVLASVLLTAEKGKVAAEATNLDLWVRHDIPARVKKHGLVLVPGDLLGRILQSLSGEVTLSLDGEILLVEAAGAKYQMPTLAPGGFPALGAVENSVSFNLSRPEFDRALACVRPWVRPHPGEARLYFQGVALRLSAGQIRLVGASVFGLSESALPCPGIEVEDFTCLVHLDTLAALSLIEGDLSVEASDSRISFAGKSVLIVAKLVDCRYPDYETQFQGSHGSNFGVSACDFIAALKRTAPIIDSKRPSILVEMSDSAIRLFAYDANGSEVEATCEAETGRASAGVVLDGPVLLSALEAMPIPADARLTITIANPSTPISISCDGLSNVRTIMSPRSDPRLSLMVEEGSEATKFNPERAA